MRIAEIALCHFMQTIGSYIAGFNSWVRKVAAIMVKVNILSECNSNSLTSKVYLSQDQVEDAPST